MDKFIIEYHPSLEDASKEINLEGEPYDPDNDDHYSEWAFAVAVREFKVGQEVTEAELSEALDIAKCQQTLDKLVDEGYVEMVWSEEHGEPVYYPTEKGKKHVEDQLP